MGFNDEKGKLIPDNLTKFAEIIENEYKEMSYKIQNINKHLHFAIDIISKQQSLSGSSVLLEKTSIKDILESAIKIGNVENNDIIIKNNLDNIPLLYKDKKNFCKS